MDEILFRLSVILRFSNNEGIWKLSKQPAMVNWSNWIRSSLGLAKEKKDPEIEDLRKSSRF